MTDFFHAPWTFKDLWVPQWLGRFGWFDYSFPNTVDNLAVLLFGAIGIVAALELVRRLRDEQDFRLQVVTFALLAAGLVVAIARVGYGLRAGGNNVFEQGRYVLPLIGLYVLALGLAATRLGRREGLALTVFSGLAAVHLIAALGLTVARYYV
jgi:hypothetical protein